jgi:hypothetical protein
MCGVTYTFPFTGVKLCSFVLDKSGGCMPFFAILDATYILPEVP